MTKSKNFWAFAAFACLILAGVSGSSIYARLALHFLDDTVEIKPRPVPLERENENPKEQETTGVTAQEEKPVPPEADAGAPEEPLKPKAVKTVFEYKSAGARSVSLAGSFAKWKDIKMARKAGIWRAEVYILPGSYLYHFTVDGRKTPDPGKPRAPNGQSVAVIGEKKPPAPAGPDRRGSAFGTKPSATASAGIQSGTPDARRSGGKSGGN